MDLGNCTIDYLTNDESGSVVIHDGHIHIENPFFEMNYDLFAFNGVVKLKGYIFVANISFPEKG